MYSSFIVNIVGSYRHLLALLLVFIEYLTNQLLKSKKQRTRANCFSNIDYIADDNDICDGMDVL